MEPPADLLPGYAELYADVATAVRLYQFAQCVQSYVFDENPAELEHEKRAEMARHIMDMVEAEVADDAYNLVAFAAAVVRRYPPPKVEGAT